MMSPEEDAHRPGKAASQDRSHGQQERVSEAFALLE